jgi:S1-C subfamily serine protease
MADTPTPEADGNWLAPEEPDWLSAASDSPTSDIASPESASVPVSTGSVRADEARASTPVERPTPKNPANPANPANAKNPTNAANPKNPTTANPAKRSAQPAKAARNDRRSAAVTPETERRPNHTKPGKTPRSRRPPRWRGRILPKSILGISLLMLATGVGAATAGTALYMNYQFRRDQSDALVKTFDKRSKDAIATVQAEGVNARRRIQDEIEPIRKIAATGDTLRDLLADSEKSIWEVSTADINGAASVGTAFVVASDSDRSFLITSFSVVRAATAKPGPKLTLRKGNESLVAELWTWQESRDLALLIVKKPSLPRLDWGISSDIRLGQQIFAVSGFGTAGGSITQGFIADVSSNGVQHTAALGSHFQGAPLLSDRGLVLGIASRSYEPYGFPSDGVWFAPPIRSTCETLLKCPATETSGAGQVTGAGTQRTDTPPADNSSADDSSATPGTGSTTEVPTTEG